MRNSRLANGFAALAIAACASRAFSEVIVLSTGEQIIATISERTDETITIQHTVLGELTIPLNNVVSIDGVSTGEVARPGQQQPGEAPEGEGAPPSEEPAATAGGAPPRSASPPEAPPEKESPWDMKLELGLNAHSGNTQDLSLRSAFTAVRETESSKLTYDVSYRYASDRGDKTEDYFTTGILAEWPQPGTRWSYFAQGRFDVADFQSWDQRLTGSGGIKYYFVDDFEEDADGNKIKGWSLAGRAGLGFRKEWGSDEDDIIPEGLLGLDLEWVISPNQSLKASSTYYPELTDPAEFRWVNSLDWVINIDQMDGVSLKLGILDEYQSSVDPGVEHNDLSVYVALVVDF